MAGQRRAARCFGSPTDRPRVELPDIHVPGKPERLASLWTPGLACHGVFRVGDKLPTRNPEAKPNTIRRLRVGPPGLEPGTVRL